MSKIIRPVKAPSDSTSPDTRLQTPNERDQTLPMTNQTGPTAPNADPVIEQAAVDAKTNLKDTSKAMETDRAYAKLRD